MAITTAAGISSTTVTTDQQAPLGFELVVPTANGGEEVFIYVENDSGSTLVVGELQTRKAGSATYQVARAGAINAATIVGVAALRSQMARLGFFSVRDTRRSSAALL